MGATEFARGNLVVGGVGMRDTPLQCLSTNSGDLCIWLKSLKPSFMVAELEPSQVVAMAVSEEVLRNMLAAVLQSMIGSGGPVFQNVPVPEGQRRNNRVIVEKEFKRVEKFGGGEAEWKIWEFDMLIPLRTCCPRIVEVFNIADVETEKVVTGALAEAGNPERYEGMATRSSGLFDVMCQLTNGEAKMLIKDVPEGDGVLAWTILKRQYIYGRR